MTASADVWPRHQRRVRDVAYRMLGSLSEAEDVVQEVWVRFDRADLDAIENLTGWLDTVTARLCLDVLRSARVRRTSYVGPWLPEPVVDPVDPASDPADRITLDDSVRIALLTVLERLTPAERTTFVLHDVFGVPFDEVATIVGRTPGACRQLASRARRHVRDGARRPVDPVDHRQVVERFRAACEDGDVAALASLLDPAATGEFDSGGALPGAPTGPVRGAQTIASLLLAGFGRARVAFRVARVNGEPGVVASLGDRVVTVIALEVDGGRVRHVQAVGNPAKLRHLGAER